MTAMTDAATDPFLRSTDGSDVSETPGVGLYEHAAGLLASACGLQAAAHEPTASAALSPTLACLEASLDALAGAAERLGVDAVEELPRGDAAHGDASFRGAELTRRFRSVVEALEHARFQCAHARTAVGPAGTCARHTAWESL